MVDHDRSRRRLGKSDDELVGFFSAAIGVRAQNMDSDGGGGDPNEWHYTRLRAMQRKTLEWFDSVAATVVQLPVEHRRVVVAVYTPHGAPTWLADALSVPWGGGSFVMLSCGLPRAALAAQERAEGRTVLDWLTARGRTAKDALLTSLREDGEDLRLAALEAYESLRRVRVKAEQDAERDGKRRREKKNAELYLEMVGKRRKVAA